MEKLLNQILKSNKAKGLVQVDSLLTSTNNFSAVKDKLVQMGYYTQGLSTRQIAILFFSLTDILFIVKDDSFYLATMSMSKIQELQQLGRIIPYNNESHYEKTYQLLQNNNINTINQYMQQGKFHLIRLNQWQDCATSFTLVSLSGMNPYPTLDTETVYCLSNVADWYHEICDNLIKGSQKLTMLDGVELCTSYLQKNKGVCTGGYILTNDLSYNPKQVPIWKVVSYEPYSNNDFIQKLLNGVVLFDNEKLTLNREILEKYYGRTN
jgi:hypothetical protein